jgi:hypothetical protein
VQIKRRCPAAEMFPFGANDGDAKKLHALDIRPVAGDTHVAPWSIAELALIAAGLIGAAVAAYLAFKLFGF